jgi:hypothetical protein
MARECAEPSSYRAAAKSLGIECPSTDFPPMRLHEGLFDPFKTTDAAADAATAPQRSEAKP